MKPLLNKPLGKVIDIGLDKDGTVMVTWESTPYGRRVISMLVDNQFKKIAKKFKIGPTKVGMIEHIEQPKSFIIGRKNFAKISEIEGIKIPLKKVKKLYDKCIKIENE